MMKPYLVASVHNNGHVTTTQPQVQGSIISPATSQALTQMLVSTAAANKITLPGYSTAIKTGTATTQGLSDTQTIASVAGYLPASKPQFVILVRVDRPNSIFGSVVAGPLWKTIAQQLMWEYNVPPDQS